MMEIEDVKVPLRTLSLLFKAAQSAITVLHVLCRISRSLFEVVILISFRMSLYTFPTLKAQ